MKRGIQFLISAIAAVFTVFIFTPAVGQNPTLTINYNATGLIPGSTINVPVVLDGPGIGTWQILIQYDREVLKYLSTTDGTHGNGLFSSSGAYPVGSDTVFKAALANTDGPYGYTYSNTTIFTINFKFIGGSTNLTYLNIATSTASTGPNFTFVKTYPGGSGGTINLGTTFIGGSASGGYSDLHSVSGGGNWFSPATWVENIKPGRAYNVFITGNEVLIPESASCHDLTIQKNGTLNLTAGKALTVYGTMVIQEENGGSGLFMNKGSVSVKETSAVK